LKEQSTEKCNKMCAEQTLENYETCALGEIFLPNIKSDDEFKDVLTLNYRLIKHSLMLPSHHPETQEAVHRNMRMGLGLTGLAQSTKEQLSWLPDAYEFLREYDEKYSDVYGMPTSIKLTTTKPSGTLSLLPGVTPGIHPAFAKYMIRRITIATEHPLVEICRKAGYLMEYKRNFDGSLDRGSLIISFPYSYSDGTILAESMSAIDQLEFIRLIQTIWSDNSVSCTVYYEASEVSNIRKYLEENYLRSFKSLSFLLRQENGFDQQPYEAISKEEFDALVASTTPIHEITTEVQFEGGEECEAGHCPIR